MAIDTSIYGQLRPVETPNLLTQYGQIAQIQNAQNQNRLAELAFGEKQREIAETASLNDAYRGALGQDGKIDRSLLMRTLADKGLGTKIQAVSKAFADQDKADADLGKVKLEAQIKATEQHKNRLNNVKTYDDAVEWVREAYTDPYLSEIMKRTGQNMMRSLAKIPQDPAQFAQWKMGNALGAEKFIEMTLPKIEFQDNGAQKVALQMNPALPGYGTPAQGVAPIVKLPTPGESLIDKRSREQMAQAERHFQAGQNAPQYMETEQGVVALPKKPTAGQPIVGQAVMGADGKPLQKKVTLPQYVVQGLAENEKTAGVIEKALQQLATPEGKNAVGWKGYLPQPILNRVDPKGVNTRADISDIGSMTVKDRSGATVTVAESPRLMPFIPAATDDDATARKKLSRMLQLIREDSEALTTFHPGAKDALEKVRAGKAKPDGASILKQADFILGL